MAREEKRERGRDRSRSPRRHSHNDRRKRRRSKSPVSTKPLPFSARLLDKHDFKAYKPVFASYLDIQKQLDITDMPEPEVKGRFKSFIGKWNRGELAEGWYDASRLSKPLTISAKPIQTMQVKGKPRDVLLEQVTVSPADSDEDYGPAPAAKMVSVNSRAGPSIPTMEDIALRREHDAEDRESAIALAKASRRAESKLEKQRQEELAPRAEAGTHERRLEKKKELAASNRTFADSKAGAAGGSGMAEVRESDLMGGGDDDSLEHMKRRKEEEQRKLSERELRRQEFARARLAEIEQRKQEFVAKEEERTKRFIELAKRRFGE